MNFERIANFDCLINPGTDANKAIILLHGYGANAQDLAPLANVFPELRTYNWYFIDGPLTLQMGMGMQARAWFHLEMMALQQAMTGGEPDKYFGKGSPEGLDKVVQDLEGLLKELANKHSEINIGGFSQGSMIATHLFAKQNKKLSKLILLSSALVDKNKMQDIYKEIDSLSVFQSHGEQDPVLPYSGAQRLKEFWEEKKYNLEFHSFSGGHEIPMPILNKLKDFILKEDI